MNTVRLALTRRWLGIFTFTTVFAVASILLGEWQFDRREYAQQQIALLNANYDVDPVPLTSIASSVDADLDDTKWRSVLLTGTYATDDITYVRNRVKQSTIGFEQLVPFTLVTGETIVVNRGWLPADAKYEAPRVSPAPPSGDVTVIARLYPDEPVVAGRSAPEGQVATINVESITGGIDGPVFAGWYGQLVSEDAEVATGSLWSRPLLDEGPHLSYALQWYVFALMGYFGYGWALVNEARGDAPAESKRSRRRAESGIASDEEIEDAAVERARR
jgi:cytochrome oxidase assembly protein ShyY1